jgi:hypothetical protein
MTKKPPVPAENRSRKGTGSAPDADEEKKPRGSKNLSQQDQQANIRQNTRNQGYQQDR